MKWRYLSLTLGMLAPLALLGVPHPMAQPAQFELLSIAQQIEALWQGKAHLQELRDVDWAKPPYNSPNEGQGWFGNPMPLPGGKWYLFNRNRLLTQKPAYCSEIATEIVVRESSDIGASWSIPVVEAAKPGPKGSPDACGVVDGSSYYDGVMDTWQMLAQCLAAHHEGGWMLCHYTRHGPSPMGPFTADAAPAVRGGQLWAQICGHSGGTCDPRHTHDEGTPDIVYKKNGYFYVTFHGFNYSTKRGFPRKFVKTADFHHWHHRRTWTCRMHRSLRRPSARAGIPVASAVAKPHVNRRQRAVHAD